MTGIVLDVKYRPEASSYEKLDLLSGFHKTLESLAIKPRAEDMSYNDLLYVLNINDVFYMDLPNYSNQLLQRVMEILSTKFKKIIYTPELDLLIDSWETFSNDEIRSSCFRMHLHLVQNRNTFKDVSYLSKRSHV